jgi:hypothetical protein
LIGCDAGAGRGGFVFLRPGGVATITSSRIIGSSAGGQASGAWVDPGSSLRVVDSTITNISGDAKFAMYDASATDFTLQLDNVIVDDTVTIFSNGTKVLMQNCDGFSSVVAKKADIATCASTSDYCLRESCIDAAVGIDCNCEVDGVEVPFPTDCMQSAVIEARQLSTTSPFCRSLLYVY